MAVVYSYIRCSTKKQTEGDTERRQVENGERWIARCGHTLAKQYSDLGMSSFKGKNRHVGALSKFLDRITSGRVKPGEILLVECLDRLSREGMRPAQDLFVKILEAGVQIATLMPSERLYTAATLASPFELMEPLLAFYLASEESKKKSERLKEVWAARRDGKHGTHWQKKCPAWVTWNEEAQRFELNEGAKAIEYIFTQTIAGVGQRALVRELAKKFTPIGTSDKWNGSYVQRVLSDRSTIGEYQPRAMTEDGKRVQVGKAIANYYPAAVKEAVFYRAQTAKKNRQKQKGPNTKLVNYFTGLLFNAHDGHAMHVVTITGKPKLDGTRHKQRRLVSYGHQCGVEGADPLTVDFIPFQKVVLAHLHEVRYEELVGRSSVSLLREQEQVVSGLETRLHQIEEDMSEPSSDDEYASLKAAAKITREKLTTARKALDVLRAETYTADPLEQLKAALDKVQGPEGPTVAPKLRMLIAELVERIDIKPESHFGKSWVTVRVKYRGGLVKFIEYGPKLHHLRSTDRIADDLPPGTFEDKSIQSLSEVAAKYESGRGRGGATVEVVDVPDALGGAASAYLAEAMNRMEKESYKTVPSKVRRFVEVLGDDLPTKNVTAKRFAQWTQFVKDEHKAGRLKTATARVTWSRAREFVRWLVVRGKCAHFADLDASGLAMFS